VNGDVNLGAQKSLLDRGCEKTDFAGIGQGRIGAKFASGGEGDDFDGDDEA